MTKTPVAAVNGKVGGLKANPMSDIQYSFHIGVPFTETNRLFWSLRRDKELLEKFGVVIPRPRFYQPALRDLIYDSQRRAEAKEELRAFFSPMEEGTIASRVILFEELALGKPTWALGSRGFFPNVQRNLTQLTQMFPESTCDFTLAISNPAIFLSTAYAQQNKRSYNGFFKNLGPEQVFWSEVIEKIIRAFPESTVKVWCDEDTPFIWNNVLHAVSGLPEGQNFQGQYDAAENIMTEEGLERMKSFIEARPELNEPQKLSVLEAFLDKFAQSEVAEQSIDLPQWTHEKVERLNELYEEDLHRIEALPRVELIKPQ